MDITATNEWRKLKHLAQGHQDLNLRTLFEQDPNRVDHMTFELGDLVVDLSKQLVTTEITEALIALANKAGLVARSTAMMAGERINTTENRAVLHTALRAPHRTASQDCTNKTNNEDGSGSKNVAIEISRLTDRMASFCDQVRAGKRLGASGQTIKNVVNLGIGGSHLGPALAYEALSAYRHESVNCHFVANIDSTALHNALKELDAASTLFVVASKTFTTQETLTNATTARKWLTHHLGEEAVSQHFLAVTANTNQALAFGIDPANCLEMWDWVGGRYSLASAIGLPLMLAIGPSQFQDMLSGMHLVDEHFATTPLDQNVPALTGLIALWYRTFCDLPTRAILPYAESLKLLPSYLQQLEMESNGKSVRSDGRKLSYHSSPIIWGDLGTNSQHSFHQLLHQGTTIVPSDFIVFAKGDFNDLDNAATHQQQLVANCFAQSSALAFGRTAQEVAKIAADPKLVPHRTFEGNRPSTTIISQKMTPAVLGQLIALYEHQTFTQGVVWGINSFDQWGVELGKSLAKNIAGELATNPTVHPQYDPSTVSLINHYQKLANTN